MAEGQPPSPTGTQTGQITGQPLLGARATSPRRRCSSSRSLPRATTNKFAVPTTSEEAEIFMQAIMGLKLWESDGIGRGETKGEIVGYNTINGANYGGSDEPLPPGACAVFAIFKDGWQTVPATKGKSARGS